MQRMTPYSPIGLKPCLSVGLTTLVAIAGSFLISLPSWAKPATLTAQDANARINLRANPTITAKVVGSGYIGNRVEVLRQRFFNEGTELWYYVRFATTAKEGWIRSDFVQFSDSSDQYGALSSSEPNDRINLRSAPSTAGRVVHYGLSGDIVKVIRDLQGDNGYTWHYVEFPSGAKGWVRGDLLIVWGEGC
ncbi:SH3 domain-containing protein [Alkalinema sp. FACHB-956]|uniref:SH3 domain-containing protein n=1 Tax=Alkalinema sp. FACHB-956 TaxID=2692768 RepID=UPI00168393F3|nr:SH3 domain-containing protein [Alkalinema sp. FACHB-956]MBD2326576.1 SH3 domain-containing protein [Alkalinema sp. FACHB-956]